MDNAADVVMDNAAGDLHPHYGFVRFKAAAGTSVLTNLLTKREVVVEGGIAQYNYSL